MFLFPFIVFSVVSWRNGEVIGHLHLKSVTAAEVDHRSEERRCARRVAAGSKESSNHR